MRGRRTQGPRARPRLREPRLFDDGQDTKRGPLLRRRLYTERRRRVQVDGNLARSPYSGLLRVVVTFSRDVFFSHTKPLNTTRVSRPRERGRLRSALGLLARGRVSFHRAHELSQRRARHGTAPSSRSSRQDARRDLSSATLQRAVCGERTQKLDISKRHTPKSLFGYVTTRARVLWPRAEMSLERSTRVRRGGMKPPFSRGVLAPAALRPAPQPTVYRFTFLQKSTKETPGNVSSIYISDSVTTESFRTSLADAVTVWLSRTLSIRVHSRESQRVHSGLFPPLPNTTPVEFVNRHTVDAVCWRSARCASVSAAHAAPSPAETETRATASAACTSRRPRSRPIGASLRLLPKALSFLCVKTTKRFHPEQTRVF